MAINDNDIEGTPKRRFREEIYALAVQKKELQSQDASAVMVCIVCMAVATVAVIPLLICLFLNAVFNSPGPVVVMTFIIAILIIVSIVKKVEINQLRRSVSGIDHSISQLRIDLEIEQKQEHLEHSGEPEEMKRSSREKIVVLNTLQTEQEKACDKISSYTGRCANSIAADMKASSFVCDKLTFSIVPEYVAYDLETTGLSPNSDRIIEIGAVKVVNGIIVDTFQELINPERKIPSKASYVNNITDDMVADCRTISDVFPDFKAFIGGFPLVSHNADFDYGFLKATNQRLYGKDFARRHYCTMKLYRKDRSEALRDEKRDTKEYYKDLCGSDWRDEFEQHYAGHSICSRLDDMAQTIVYDKQVVAEYESGSHRALIDAKVVYLAFEHLKKWHLKPAPPVNSEAGKRIAEFASRISDLRVCFGSVPELADTNAPIIVPDYVSYSIDTTSNSAHSGRIIGIGAVKVSGGVIIDTFQAFSDASNDYQDTIPVFLSFKKFISRLPLVAHNSAFSYAFLKTASDRVCGKDFIRRHYCTNELFQKERMHEVRSKEQSYRDAYGTGWRDIFQNDLNDQCKRYELCDLFNTAVTDEQIIAEYHNDTHCALTDAKIVYLAFEFLKTYHINPPKPKPPLPLPSPLD